MSTLAEESNLGEIVGTDRAKRASESLPKPVLGSKLGGPCRARTYDPLIKSQLLYQLS